MTDTGDIDHTQAASTFGAPFLRIQGEPAGQRKVPSAWGRKCDPAMHPMRETAHIGGR